jgi:hypothetical protein
MRISAISQGSQSFGNSISSAFRTISLPIQRFSRVKEILGVKGRSVPILAISQSDFDSLVAHPGFGLCEQFSLPIFVEKFHGGRTKLSE